MDKLICNLYDQVAKNINLKNGKEILKSSDEYKKVSIEAPATADSFTNYFDNPVSKKTLPLVLEQFPSLSLLHFLAVHKPDIQVNHQVIKRYPAGILPPETDH